MDSRVRAERSFIWSTGRYASSRTERAFDSAESLEMVALVANDTLASRINKTGHRRLRRISTAAQHAYRENACRTQRGTTATYGSKGARGSLRR